MQAKLKRIIIPTLIASLIINFVLCIYVLDIKISYENNVELLEENNKLLKENNDNLENNISNEQEQKEYYQNKYYDYFEYSIELEQQMGIFR